jgi:hypothetical protein
VSAKSRYNDSLDFCNAQDKNLCTQQGVDKRDQARSAGVAATVAVGLGGAAFIAGAVLFFTAPSSAEKPSAVLVPAVAPGSAALVLSGAY